jgi:hypothetical protein
MSPLRSLAAGLLLSFAGCSSSSPAPAPSAETQACDADDACPPGETCQGGVCAAGATTCASGLDCASGKCDLLTGTCVAPGGSGPADAGTPAATVAKVRVVDLQQVPVTARHPPVGAAIEVDRAIAMSARLALDGAPALFLADAPLIAGGQVGEFSGILVVVPANVSVQPGDVVTVKGTYEVTDGVGRIVAESVAKTGAATLPAAASSSVEELATPGGAASWEGSLVVLHAVSVAPQALAGGFSVAAAGSARTGVDLRFAHAVRVNAGDRLLSVTGFVHRGAAGLRVLPRTPADVVAEPPPPLDTDGDGNPDATDPCPANPSPTCTTTPTGGGSGTGTSSSGPRAPQPGELRINEFLADPPSGIAGDANGDGYRDSDEDEFIEFVNATTDTLDLAGVQILTEDFFGDLTVRGVFPRNLALGPGKAIVVFGGGDPFGTDFGGTKVLAISDYCDPITPCLVLRNGGSTIQLASADDEPLDEVSYGSQLGSHNQSANLAPEITGTGYVLHEALSPGSSYSPGTRADGTPF